MKKAFTIVEIVITIAITSALALFASGQYGNVTRDSRLVKVKSDLKIVRDATAEYITKTEYIPVNSSGIGIAKGDFKIADKEYIMLNLDLLAREQLMQDGEKVPACIPNIPVSASYTKAGLKNIKKQEPSFIYVIDNSLNVYLATAEKDDTTGYFIYTKIYETAEANIYDKKVKMSYEGNRPILEQTYDMVENIEEGSTTIKDNIQIVPDIALDIFDGGNSDEGVKNINELYYKDLSIAGFNVFLDAYDIDIGKIDSIDMDVKAGPYSSTKTLYAIKASRWLGIINVKDFQYYSGNYECKVYAITKNKEKVDIGSFVILVDRIKPTVAINKSRSDFYSSSPINVDIVASDTELSSGIKKIQYKINDEEWLDYTGTIKLSDPDYYQIQAIAIDNFDNKSKITSTIINNYTNPEIYLTKTGSSIAINLGVDIDDDDVLWRNGFETTDKAPSLNVYNTPAYGVSGGQSISNLDSFEGDRSYKLLKNDDQNGNVYYYPATSSSTSRMNLGSLTKTITNNMYLSIVYRYKSYENSVIRASLDGGWARAIKYRNCTIVEDVPVGSNTIKLDSVAGLTLGSHITCDTDPMKPSNLPRIETIDQETNTITIIGKVNRTIPAGEKLAYRDWRGGGSFATNNTPDTDGEWRLFTSVMKTSTNSDYDLYEYGSGAFLMQNTASKEMYIDNIKMGFASRMILYKNGVRFNTISQEYTTSYVDNDVPDKNSPIIEDVFIKNTSNNYVIDIKANDVGTVYEYSMESISRNGNVKESKVRSVTMTSGINKYYYLINNSPSTSIIPTSESTSDSVISMILDKNQSWYIHVVAEDGSGNKSSIYHKQVN